MPERRLTSLTNNKRKLLDYVGATSMKAFRRENPNFKSDATAYNYILGEYNNEVDRLNEEERQRKDALKKQINDYYKEKRASSGSYKKADYKLIGKNNKINSAIKKNKNGTNEDSDLTKYNTEKGIFACEVRVYYDCSQKADDWTEDNKTWKVPFRAYRAEIVIGNSRGDLKEKADYTYDKLEYGLQNKSPELNTNFEKQIGKVYNSNQKVPITKIKMRNSNAFKLNGEPLPSFEMGEGKCVYDALIYLWSKPNSKMQKKANKEYLNSIFTTDENPNPEQDGVDTQQIYELARSEGISMYAFDIHDKIITTYVAPRTERVNKSPIIYRLYNEHMYLICDRAIQASLIAKNRDSENIRHNNIENDKKKYIVEDTKTYTNIIPTEQDLTGNDFVYDYIFNNNEIPFPFTNNNINYDKGHIRSMKIDDKRVFTKPVEPDILKYLSKKNEEYKGQHYINILMETWKEHYGNTLAENELISKMNPIVCDMLNEENVKNRVHYGSIMQINDMNTKIDSGEIVGVDLIKCYSSILDNPIDNWLVYQCTDEVEAYDGVIKTGLYFVETNDITILHLSNWYSNTIIEYALKYGIELKIIRQYIPAKQDKNKDYFKEYIDYISETCGMTLTKNILNSITGMFGKTRQSSYTTNITTDINEIWNCLDKNCDKLDDFFLKEVERQKGKILYIYGFKNKKNIYTNNLPMYIQVLDQSNIKLHQLSMQVGGEIVFRKTDAVILYRGPNNYADLKSYDKKLRTDWGKYTIMDKDELKKYDYGFKANLTRNVINPFEDNDTNGWAWNNNLTSSSQYKDIIEYAIKKGGLLICSRAGTGKSYIINKSVEDKLVDDDKRTRLAFTNRARRNINGTTIHSAISINSEIGKASSKMVETYKNKKVIIIDEVSMISQELWNYLIILKRISGAIFILMGDYRQLPAVEKADHDYFDSSIMKFLTNHNRIELLERQRYDKELWDFLEDFYNNGVVGSNLKVSKDIDPDAYNICYYNKTRVHVNKLYMDYHKPSDALFIPYKTNKDNDKDDRASDIYIYEGLPVMSVVNKTKKNTNDGMVHQSQYCNSDTMRVLKYTDEIITMKLDVPDEDGNELIDVRVDEFHKSFVCNYCSTTHKNQGATIDNNIQLWDWEKMTKDRRIAYTAISRARCIQQVQVVA